MPSTSRSRGSARVLDGALRTQVIAPMSERQQLALVMQISSQDAPPAAPTPGEERKQTRQQRNERGETPLHVAAIRGDHNQVKKYLYQGQDPNVPDFADGGQLSSGVVSSTQDDLVPVSSKRSYIEDSHEAEPAEDETTKRKKRKEIEDRELMAKPAPVSRSGTGRKPPGPASKTGAAPLKGGASQSKASGSSGKGVQSQGKGGGAGGKAGAQSHQGKSGTAKGASSSQAGKQDRKSPVASPRPHHGKDNNDDEEQKAESTAPKVPPLKIVIPGGAGGSGSRNDQEGEGGSGQRGSGKGRGNSSTLPYVIPCTSTDTGQTSDSSDGICEDKRAIESKAGQRVLRSHRANDGDKDKGRTSPTGSEARSGSNQAFNTNKSPSRAGQDGDHAHSTSSGAGGRHDSGATSDLHPRKRKLKSSRDSHSRDHKNETPDSTTATHNITHCNPYQMYIHIRKQIERRQKALFPVKPKPPKDFNKYLMNRCTYTLQNTVNPEPQVDIPHTMPTQMINDFLAHEKERMHLRIQHLVEKEKLVLAVEQEILRVHGRAERAVANQALPFSVCTILRDKEVYNVLAPDQEEKRNAQRSRCNGRQINSWLQEVDDKWEKIKEGMLRRQHTEAETLHAVQLMGWEWTLKEMGLCDNKSSPKIDSTHVPQIHVSNFDLPA